MAVRADGVQLPSALMRWLFSQSNGIAVLAGLATLIRNRLRRISVPPMSEEWLLNHDRDTHDGDNSR
jgi:hypothetical protein